MIEAIDNRNMRFFESVADGGNAKPHTRTALKGGLTLMQVIEDARKSLETLTPGADQSWGCFKIWTRSSSMWP